MEGFGDKKAAYTDGNTHSVIRTDLNPRLKNAQSLVTLTLKWLR